MSSRPDALSPWVLVSGGFHRRGAMDRVNLALAEYLLAAGRDVHLVGHAFDPVLLGARGAHVHRVRRYGAVAAGELALERTARRVTAAVAERVPTVRVLGNGGAYPARDANWVHSVHHVWPPAARSSPWLYRLRDRIERPWFRRREARAMRAARVILANSPRTREDLIGHLPVNPSRIHVIPPGADPSWKPPSAAERRDARLQAGCEGPMVAFIGALGADDNKGFGPLLDSWRSLCADASWRGTLLVAGRGPLLAHWQRVSRRAGLDGRVRFLRFVPDVSKVLAAADVLVSASRYESYGLAIAEAFCRGVPAIVPGTAGIRPALGPDCDGLSIQGEPNASSLADVLRRWAADRPHWQAVASRVGQALRSYTLEDMAASIVRTVET